MNKLTDLYIKYKPNVDFVVLGLTVFLAVFAFGTMGLAAYLHWKMSGTIVYAAIWLTGIVVLFISLIPAYRIHKLTQKVQNENRN